MSNTRVLIVDDESGNIQLLEELFGLHGYEVLAATDGRQALEAARREKPDLVLLDVMMPGMDGFEVCRRLKADPATRRLPVVMVTGLGELDDKIKGLEAGADDFLSKPVNAAELLTRSRSLLRVKQLNDELEGAYNRLADIASFTNTLLKKFDPYLFDVKTSLGQLMDFLLSPHNRTRPQRVLLLSASERGGWGGWVYYEVDGLVAHRPLHNSIAPEEVGRLFGDTSILALNLDETSDGRVLQSPLWQKMGESPPKANLVGYHSGELAIITLDAGKRVGRYDAEVLSGLAATIHFFLKTISSQIREVERAFLYTITALARAAEMHDEDTGTHIVRVNRYSEMLARALGCDDSFVRTIGYSAQMHDVGKMHVHPDILRKPARLTDDEWSEVKRHTVYGVRILGEDPRLAMAREVALNHHEHWDGSGYPNGLAGEDIPISGRIVMMADVYDALRSHRPYKKPFNHQQAVRIITQGDDRLKPEWFDPRVLEAFGDLQHRFEQIFEEIRDHEH